MFKIVTPLRSPERTMGWVELLDEALSPEVDLGDYSSWFASVVRTGRMTGISTTLVSFETNGNKSYLLYTNQGLFTKELLEFLNEADNPDEKWIAEFIGEENE